MEAPMGQLNIKDEALIADAKRLAEQMGTTVTAALRAAVEEKLARREAEREAKFQAIMAIAREASKLVPPGVTSDHSDLYDENGLPK
jgi:antitoxin VapB